MKLTLSVAILAVLIAAPTTAGQDAKPAAQASGRENPVRLETIISLATGPQGETPEQANARAARFDREIDRLLEVLSKASGKKRKAPVRMSGLPAKKISVENNGIFHLDRAYADGAYAHVDHCAGSFRNSVVVFDIDAHSFDGVDVENCIVIAQCRGRLTEVRNSIVLARYDVSVGDAEECVLLSGCDMRLNSVSQCVCATRKHLAWINRPSVKESLLVETDIDKVRPKGNWRTARLDSLDLTPPFNALDDAVEITAASPVDGVFALLRTKDGKGEYVARRGQPVLDPSGRPIAALEGWRLTRVLNSLAVFEKDGRRALLRIVPPKPRQALPRALPLPPPSADDGKPANVPAEVRRRVEQLLKQLDADDFRTRTKAEAELVTIAKPALESLRKLQANSPSPEARLRAERAVRRIERAISLADVHNHPVRLETLIRLGAGPDDETPEAAKVRAERFDRELQRLLDVLSEKKTGAPQTPPVRLVGLPIAKAGETVNGRYVRVDAETRLTAVRNSVVVLQRGSHVTSIENCIVIVPDDAKLYTVRNSIVLGRYSVYLPGLGGTATESVILSCFDAWIYTANRCVCGADRELTIPRREDTVGVNSKRNRWNDRDGIQVEGLDLTPPLDDSLAARVELTYIANRQEGIVLLRTSDGKGEYVARYGQPILDPDGKPLAALEGWRLNRAAGHEFAVFMKDGRYAVLEVGKRASR